MDLFKKVHFSSEIQDFDVRNVQFSTYILVFVIIYVLFILK